MNFSNIQSYFKKPDSLVVFLLLFWWIVNLIQAAFTELHFDEAYYWLYSQNLAWGYFDHPPLIAWLIRSGTVIFGNTQFGVRFFIVLLQPVYLYLFWKLMRPTEATTKMAVLYFLLCASIPVMQAYGFIATPDAPLLFSTVLFLTAYRAFLKKESWQTACFTGITIALLIYSKYHGVLVVAFTLLPNIFKLLKSKWFYIAILTAIIAMIPYFVWLYDHNFITLRYHLMERNKHFKMEYIIEFPLNLIACYHPLIFPVFIYALFKRKAQNIFEKGLYWLAIGFYLFFLFSTLRGHVQPQWFLPTVFTLIFVTFNYIQKNPKTTKVVRIVAYVSIALYMGLRIFLITGTVNNEKLLFFKNPERYESIAKAAGGHPVLFLPSYSNTSMYMFYTGKPAATQFNSIDRRSNQFWLWDYDDQLAGKTVLIESKTGDSIISLTGGKDFRYDYYENYLPVRRMKVEILDMPENLIANEFINLDIKITNPYNYDIPIGNDDDVAHVHVVMKKHRKIVYDVIPRINNHIVKAGSNTIINTRFKIPEIEGITNIYISIQQQNLYYDDNNIKPVKVNIKKPDIQ